MLVLTIVGFARTDDKAAMKEAMELEDFFHSSWYGVLTQVDPDYLIDRLRKETVK